MRKYLEIDLSRQKVSERQLAGRELAEAGRYLIARTLVERNVATVDPFDPDNPLIFSVGPFRIDSINRHRISRNVRFSDFHVDADTPRLMRLMSMCEFRPTRLTDFTSMCELFATSLTPTTTTIRLNA